MLKKFAGLEPKCFIQLQKLAPKVVTQLSQSNSKSNENSTGLASESDKRKENARERQAAVLEKMKAQHFCLAIFLQVYLFDWCLVKYSWDSDFSGF